MTMKVLIACEESQEVCKAFRKLGHEAYSCDILPCSGGHPEWHFECDVLDILNGGRYPTSDGIEHDIDKWDLMIAHPPYTYLSNAGARFLYPKGILNIERKEKGDKSKEFFMKLMNSEIKKICIENPIPSKIFGLPQYSQIIQPFEFGHPFKKRTCLWLKGLGKLMPTSIVKESQSTKVPGNWFNKGGNERQKNRAKTFPGIAKAMAEQWGNLRDVGGISK